MKTAILMALTAVILGGCTVATPKARVADVVIAEQTDEGVRMVTTVELENPNNTALPLPRVQYTLTVDGAGSFDFVTVPAETLPKKGVSLLELSAALPVDQDLTGKAYSVSGAVSYRPPGEIRTLLSQYRFPLPFTLFSASGTIE